MMPILVKNGDVRTGRKAKVRNGRLRASQESMGVNESIKFSILVNCLKFSPKTKGFLFKLPSFRMSDDFPSFH